MFLRGALKELGIIWEGLGVTGRILVGSRMYSEALGGYWGHWDHTGWL